MKINNHSVGIEKVVTSEQITEFLFKVFGARVVDSSLEDYLEHDGWFDYSPHKHGFATHINISLMFAQYDLSHEELAPLVAKEFQTKVVVDLPDGHPLELHPYYWQLFDEEGDRYLMSDREPDPDEDEFEEDEEGGYGFLIYQMAPWPGESIYPGWDEDDD